MQALVDYSSEEEAVLDTGNTLADTQQATTALGAPALGVTLQYLQNSSDQQPRGAAEGEDLSPQRKKARFGHGVDILIARPPGPRLLPSAAELFGDALQAGGKDSLKAAPPVLHKGRLRCFPHVEGNFATHAYIAVSIPESSRDALQRQLRKVAAHVPGLQPISEQTPAQAAGVAFPVPAELHLSLSRTVALRRPQIDSLLASLQRLLRRTDSWRIRFTGLESYVNDDHTRSFLAVGVDEGAAQVRRAISQVDKAFILHQLQPFYAEPRPHVSIAWSLGDVQTELDAGIRHTQSDQQPFDWTMQVH